MTNISRHGIWVLAHGEKIFLPYKSFPSFKKGSVEAVLNVAENSPGNFHWPDRDVDLSIDSMRNPDRYPLSSRSPEHFVVQPHSGGFRPGIDPDKLNQFLDELEVEDFAEDCSAE